MQVHGTTNERLLSKLKEWHLKIKRAVFYGEGLFYAKTQKKNSYERGGLEGARPFVRGNPFPKTGINEQCRLVKGSFTPRLKKCVLMRRGGL